ncbi:hypothetical protein HPB47_005205 [Ixodes persulcatus]|uniref:Uncharacterized protein n=1 Tax=Ixodes persulcatus TaxID=34615 RepID=A0AC60PE35_IXOPE|nr:hypothetical protein HPB47_005205 [Ixodes persulcatus]
MQHGDMVKWRLPGLAFADDLVLMADNVADMKVLLTTCEAEAAQLRLHFNATEARVLVGGPPVTLAEKASLETLLRDSCQQIDSSDKERGSA